MHTLHDSQVEPPEREHHDKEGRETPPNDNKNRKADGHGAAQALDDTGENLVNNVRVSRKEVENPGKGVYQ